MWITLHIIGAGILFGLMSWVLGAIIFHKVAPWIILAKYIAAATLYEIITGSAVALARINQPRPIVFCSKLLMYIMLTIIIEYILLLKIRRQQLVYPNRFVVLILNTCVIILATATIELFYQ